MRRTPSVAKQVIPAFRPTNALFQARLIDFDTGSATLEQQHKNFLVSAINRAKINSAFHVQILGFASRLGDAGANERLSLARMQSVFNFLKSQDGRVRNSIELFQFGESVSGGGENDNSPEFRAVEVHIFIGEIPPIDPPGFKKVDPPKPNAPEQRLVAKKTFEQKFIDRPAVDLSPDSAGVGFALGTALNQGIKDVLRMNKNPIEGGDFDDGVVQERKTSDVVSGQIMKTVDIEKEVRQLPSLVTFGASALRFNINRTYRYSYGVGLRTELVRVSTTTTLIPLLENRSVLRDTRTVRQPSNFLDPR